MPMTREATASFPASSLTPTLASRSMGASTVPTSSEKASVVSMEVSGCQQVIATGRCNGSKCEKEDDALQGVHAESLQVSVADVYIALVI